MFFRSGEDKDRMCGRFLQCLEESVECLYGEHMHLIDDIDAVSADLRRDTYLVDQVADIIDRVVRGGIQFVDVERTVFVESLAGFAFVACFGIGCRVQTVDRFGEDTGASGFTHTTWTAKQIRMGQLTATDGIFQCRGNM